MSDRPQSEPASGPEAAALERPRRRWELKLEIAADDIETLEAYFNELRDDFFRKDVRESHGGGFSGRHSLTVTEDSGMDHETYMKQLEAYLAAKRMESGGS